MTTDELDRKLRCAIDREQEKLARADAKTKRGRANMEVGTRQADTARRRINYFQDRCRELESSVIAGVDLP